jgi:phage baseplate assembly protein W
MTEPITDLIYEWVDQVGITFSWTAATDVTNKSSYEIYYLDTSHNLPIWVQFAQLNPIPVKSTTSVAHVLTPPATSYLFEWGKLTQLVQNKNIPGFNNDSSSSPVCVALQVQHTDYTGTESEPATIFAFPLPINKPTSAIHLKNNFNFDNFGQASVNVQDTYDEISDSVAAMLGTISGQRTLVPNYGIDDLPLGSINLQTLAEDAKMWEPRAIVEFQVSYNNQGIASLTASLKTDIGV